MNKVNLVAVLLLGTIVLVVTVGMLTVNTPPVNSVAASHGGYVSSGEGYLRSDSGDDIPVIRSKKLYDEFVHASAIGDDIGAAQAMLLGGFFVPSSTKVLVIDYATEARKVRILDGKSAGDSGWVYQHWITKE